MPAVQLVIEVSVRRPRGPRPGQADELIAAGATEIRHESTRAYDRFSVQLADPEGNEFCLV